MEVGAIGEAKDRMAVGVATSLKHELTIRILKLVSRPDD